MQSVLQLIACWFGVTHKSGSGCVSDSSACQVALSGLNFLPCLIVSYFVLFGYHLFSEARIVEEWICKRGEGGMCLTYGFY